MRTAALAPTNEKEENAEITKASLKMALVSGAVAGILGLDIVSVGLLAGGGAWLWGKGKQLLQNR